MFPIAQRHVECAFDAVILRRKKAGDGFASRAFIRASPEIAAGAYGHGVAAHQFNRQFQVKLRSAD
ncbi:MAG: hypothetical protein R3C40_12195 [Parvularculaceae bacterium]